MKITENFKGQALRNFLSNFEDNFSDAMGKTTTEILQKSLCGNTIPVAIGWFLRWKHFRRIKEAKIK